MAKRRKKRWTQTAVKAAKKPITTPRAEPKKRAKRRPDGIHYDNCKVKP